MKRQFSDIFAPIAVLSLILAPLTLTISPAMADALKARIQQDDVRHTDGPALKRSEGPRGAEDPFGAEAKDDVGMLQAPPGSMDSVFEGKPLRGNANDSGGDGQFGQGVPALEPDNSAPHQGGAQSDAPFQQRTNTPNLESEKARMDRLLWDAWHKRVAETIYTRFNNSAQTLFKRSQPLSCQVSYMVARDGRIGQVRVLQASNNPIYDSMLVMVIKSIAGNPVLQYPPNSNRQFVEKSGTFTWNYSNNQGFKYLQGDQERIQHK